jgi:hypothetical protein
VSGLLYRFSSSLLNLIRHVPFVLARPCILRNTFLSQDMRVAVDYSVSVQVGFTTEKDSRLNNCFIYIFVLIFPDIYLSCIETSVAYSISTFHSYLQPSHCYPL